MSQSDDFVLCRDERGTFMVDVGPVEVPVHETLLSSFTDRPPAPVISMAYWRHRLRPSADLVDEDPLDCA